VNTGAVRPLKKDAIEISETVKIVIFVVPDLAVIRTKNTYNVKKEDEPEWPFAWS